jgi:hypothetical protein
MPAPTEYGMFGIQPIPFRDLGDGRGLWVYRMIYTYKLVIGTIGAPCYDSDWCYKDRASAMAAFNHWNPATEPEPSGWVRHPPSGRRRFPDGDPATEEVRA